MTQRSRERPPPDDDALAAPGELELVRRFVNTRDLELLTDTISTPGGLAAWLLDHGLVDRPIRVTRRDLARARDVREGLRALLLANAGAALDRQALDAMDAACRDAMVRMRTGGGALTLEPAGTGVLAALARLLAIVAVAQADGSWPRLKACPGERCQWALYDHTRNATRTWCDPAKCGSRTRARAYRRRRHGRRAR